MKQKDIALIIVIGAVSAVFSLVLSNLLFSSDKTRNLTAEVVTDITADFQSPDARYFNSESVNPTQIIRIGENENQAPFNQ